MPDITFIGLNRLRMIAERGVNVDLKPFIAKDGDMAAQGFSDSILRLAQVRRSAGRACLRNFEPDHVLQCRPRPRGGRQSRPAAEDMG